MKQRYNHLLKEIAMLKLTATPSRGNILQRIILGRQCSVGRGIPLRDKGGNKHINRGIKYNLHTLEII